MAERQVGGLGIRIGLMLSQLQSDFLAAEQTVRQGIATLNRQQNIVKLRMDTDIAGLDAVVDKTKILEVQERGLTQLLEMQRDKLALITAAYHDYAASKGANDVGAKKLEASMERERLAVVRLEAELKNLSAQKISIDTTQLQSNIARINAQIQHIRLKAEFDTTALSGAAAAFDAQKIHIAAVTRELELQRQKLIQLRAAMIESARRNGVDNVQTLNIKSNVLTQMQEIQKLEAKLKELQNTNVNLQIRADNIQKAEQTITENIARINAKMDLIRIKAEVDTSKLGAAASKFDKAKIHVQALTRELELQTQKLRELQKAFATSVSSNGLNNVKTINLGTDIQRQIQEINQLKAKLDELGKIKPPNGLLNGYLNIRDDVVGKLNGITSAFNGVATASHSADGAISKSLEIIGAIPHPVGKAVAAFASIPLVIKGVESSLLSMAESVVAAGDAFYVMSRGMQLSIADAAQLSTIAKVTGIEISEINNTMRRFSMQLTKGGEKSSLMAQTLKIYGAELTDETGRLKNELELAQELGKAFRAAESAGNGAAFRDIVGGKFWSGDFVTFLEDLSDNIEAAKQVVKNGLANPAFAHQIQGEINTLNAQVGQLGGVFESALLPVVHEIVPRMTERFGELTKVIQANKENIKFFGDALALPVRVINEMTDGVISLSKAIDEAKDKRTALGQFFATIGNYRDDVAALMNVAPTTALTAIFAPLGSTEFAVAAYREEIEEYKKAQAEAENTAKAKQEKAAAIVEKTLALNKANLEAQQKLETALASTEERRIKFTQEAEDTILGIRSSSYEKQLREHERWQDEELAKIREFQKLAKDVLGDEGEGIFDEEEAAFYELDEAKLLQIEEEKKQRIAEIEQQITATKQTELEKRMAAIDAEKEKWIQAGMERAEAEQLAEQQKADYIKGVEDELSATIDGLHQSDLEKRLAEIEREKQAWIDKGASQEKAEQLAQEKIAQAYQQQADKLNGIRESVASLYRSDVENRIAAIDKEQQAWEEAGMSEAEAAELASLKKQKIYEEETQKVQDEADNRAKAEEDYQKKVQAAQEEADRKNKAARDEAWNVLKSESDEFGAYLSGGKEGLKDYLRKQLAKSGVNFDQARAMTPEKLESYKSAKDDAMRSLLPNWEDPYVPDTVQKSFKAVSDSSDAAAEGLVEVANAAKEAASGYAGRTSTQDEEKQAPPIGTYLLPDGSTIVTNVSDARAANLPVINELGTAPKDSATADQTVSDLADQSQSVQRTLEEFAEAVQSTVETLNELPTSLQSVMESLAEMNNPQFEEPLNPFENLEPEIQQVVQQYAEMNSAVEAVTIKLSELNAILSEISAPQRSEPQPVNVTNSIQIDEAHAWDYDHIQELAERVADIIKPAIIDAIGGDSNSY